MNYHIARDGQQLGVFSEEDVRSRLNSNQFLPSDLYWGEGMSDWRALGSSPEFQTSPAANPQSGSYAPAAGGNPYQMPQAGSLNPYAPPVSNVVRSGPSTQAELAGLGQRLGAALLDALTALVAAVPLIVGVGMQEESVGNETVSTGLMMLGGLALLGLVIYNLVLMTTRGQSLGKKWLNIRIATYDNNDNPGFVKAVLLRGFVNGLIGNIPLVGPIYSLVDICFIFREDRRCIHDLIASTHVVKGSLP